jgi:hypothetical protein
VTRRRAHLAAVVAAVLAVVAACTLNPQPLPPSPIEAEESADAGFNTAPDRLHDSGTSPPPAGDADAGDGGDAGTDAGDGGDAG